MKPFSRTALLHPPNANRITMVRKSVVLTIVVLAVSAICHAQSQPIDPDKNYKNLQKAITKLFKNHPPEPKEYGARQGSTEN